MFQNKKIKIAVIIITITLIVFGIYYFYSSKKSGEELRIIDMDKTEPVASEDILQECERIFNLLDQLKTIKLDTGFFENKFFNSLVDFSVELTPEPVGRDNPFAPIK